MVMVYKLFHSVHKRVDIAKLEAMWEKKKH
jgi:hypothetical protein